MFTRIVVKLFFTCLHQVQKGLAISPTDLRHHTVELIKELQES